MCTVTYIPLGENKFIFTSNRDEAPKRSAVELAEKKVEGKIIYFPKDAKANGTWIAISNKNQLVCILNGAFKKHKHDPPYRLSRGTMALDFFTFENSTAFFENYNFKGIEPFTFIIFDDGRLRELRWDEKKAHVKELATDKKHLWASCTLYDDHWQQKRQEWFANWLAEKKEMTQENIIDFHKNGGEGHPIFDLVMNYKDIVRTTSITSVSKNDLYASIRYEGLQNEIVWKKRLRY